MALGCRRRRYKEFNDDAASWDRVERIIAHVEAGPLGVDTRFIVTSLTAGSPRRLYEDLYCARGQTENHIKAWKCGFRLKPARYSEVKPATVPI